ncbi:MAG: signal peptidase I [Candidatus Epulonipiscium fishelsonii]|nr:MAG: signal peptidase I [Epulopiscium sp. AS2M-Bin002]
MRALKIIRNSVEFVKDIILVIMVSLVILPFIAIKTYIPTGSMIPTININDHMFVSNIPFYYRNPKREEIIVFRYGRNNLVKRVIGLPGETIDMKDGKVYIDGKELNESEYIRFPDTTYPQAVSFPYTVPEGHYFVMGDNRENSADSRSFGAVSRDVIFALGGYRVYPFNNIGVVD